MSKSPLRVRAGIVQEISIAKKQRLKIAGMAARQEWRKLTVYATSQLRDGYREW